MVIHIHKHDDVTIQYAYKEDETLNNVTERIKTAIYVSLEPTSSRSVLVMWYTDYSNDFPRSQWKLAVIVKGNNGYIRSSDCLHCKWENQACLYPLKVSTYERSTNVHTEESSRFDPMQIIVELHSDDSPGGL